MKNILLFLSILSLAACAKYETQFEGEYEDSSEPKVVTPITDILFVESGVMKWTDAKFMKVSPVKVTEKVLKARANDTNTKIAYIRQVDNSIVIIDSSGANAVKIPNTANTKCIFWHNNDETLCYVTGTNQIKTYGKAVTLLPSSTINMVKTYAVVEVYEMDILENGSLIGLFEVYKDFVHENAVGVDNPNGTTDDYYYLFNRYPTPKALKVSKNKFNFIYANASGFDIGVSEYYLGSLGAASNDFDNYYWRIFNKTGDAVAEVYNNKLSIINRSITVKQTEITDIDW